MTNSSSMKSYGGYGKQSANHVSSDPDEDDKRIFSKTDDFTFVIYSTYTGNRKTLSIYRNADGEIKEVNFILSFKPAKNIGKKIKKAITTLKKLPLNKLNQTYMQMLRDTTHLNEQQVIMHIKETKDMKDPKYTLDQLLTQEMNDKNYKHDFVEYIKRVCRTCQTFGDCVEVDDIPVCEKCRASKDFDTKYDEAQIKRYESRGFVPPQKSQWCRSCGGDGQPSYTERDYMNEFGTACKNPDCTRMLVCDIHHAIWNKDCAENCVIENEYQYSGMKRFVTFDLTIQQRVCRGCLNYGDTQTIGKRQLCKNCKQIRVERIDVDLEQAKKHICNFCKELVLPSQVYVSWIKTKELIHTKCYDQLGLGLQDGTRTKLGYEIKGDATRKAAASLASEGMINRGTKL